MHDLSTGDPCPMCQRMPCICIHPVRPSSGFPPVQSWQVTYPDTPGDAYPVPPEDAKVEWSGDFVEEIRQLRMAIVALTEQLKEAEAT